MTTAEIKLDMFRKIDNLSESQLEKIYHVFLSLLKFEKYSLSDAEKLAGF